MKKTLLSLAVAVVATMAVQAQVFNDQPTYPGRANYGALKFSQPSAWFNYLMLNQHLRDDQRRQDFQTALTSRKAMEAYVADVQQKMQQLAGPLPERGDTRGRVVGTVEGPGFRVDKIVFQSYPGHYVTAHLYLPAEAAPKKGYPVCVEMCGHGLRGKGNGSGTAIQMARNGIAVLVTDPIGQGEMQQLIDAEGRNLTRGVTTAHTLVAPLYNLLGSSMAARHYFDNSRAIDYLVSRQDINPQRVGCYGFSGGGTEASYLLALDKRIQAACVGLFFSDRTRTLEIQGPSDGCQQIPGEGALGINHADMALCMAPRPFLVLDGLYDFVDHYGALSSFAELEKAYGVLGHPERVAQYYSEDGHACPPDAMVRLVGWFKRWLGDGKPLAADAVKLDEAAARWQGRDMLCTAKGQVNLEFPDALSAMQEAQQQMDALAEARRQFCAQPQAELRRQMLTLLGLDALPDSVEVVRTGFTDGRDYKEYRFQLNSPGQMPVPVVLWVPDDVKADAPIEVHLHEQGKAWFLTDQLRRDRVSDGRILMAADVRGVGELEDAYIYNLTKYWNREYRSAVVALHENRPLVGQRVCDVVTLLNFCAQASELQGRRVEVVADGLYGPVVMHAAVLDDRIARATLTRTLKTWRDYLANPMQRDMYTNVIQGVLGHYDLPDLVRLAQGRVRIVD